MKTQFQWLGVATLLAIATAGTLNAAPITELKVMSFNIWVNGRGGLTNCIEAIRTSGADIVGLQECNAATARTIATNLGFHVIPADGCSIVSRYPIASSQAVGRFRSAVILLSPGQRVHLFNCHLTAYPYGPYDLKQGKSKEFIINQENTFRTKDLNELLAVMKPFIAGSEPCFLVGDFNAPSHLDYADFPWPTSVVSIDAGLGDSYRELHQGNRKYPGLFAFDEPGITWTPKIAEEPEGVFDRIDFVYYSKGDGANPTSSAELDQRNSVNPWPSDHRAVLTTFTITPPQAGAQASEPLPQNQATNVITNPTLNWLPGSNATSHAVFVGLNSPGVFLTNTTSTILNLATLLPGTTYYWRVDEITPTGTVTGAVWSFTTKSTNAIAYEWNFKNGNLAPTLGNGVLAYADGATTSNLTSFGTTDGTTVPHINGKPAKFLHAPAFAAVGNGYLVTFTDSGPNGGGAYINQFTMIFDVLVPGSLNWLPLFNTNPANANDADFYLDPFGALGIAAIGYSAPDVVTPNTWRRLAFTANLATGVVEYYVNGNNVFSGGATLDGRHSLYSNLDPGPDLLLFNEGDTSATYTHEFYLSSFFFTDRTMNDAEILALGGPQARGVLAQSPPISVRAARMGTNLALAWSGGDGYYQLQRNGTLDDALWEAVSSSTSDTNRLVPIEGESGYYRVVGL